MLLISDLQRADEHVATAGSPIGRTVSRTWADRNPDLRARTAEIVDASADLEPAELVAALTNMLGSQLVAYIASVRDVALIRRWSEGASVPDETTLTKLRLGYSAAHLIAQAQGSPMARAWMVGLAVDDRSAATLIRTNTPTAVEGEILGAAMAYLANG